MKVNGLKLLQTGLTVALVLAMGVFLGYYFGARGYEVNFVKDLKPVEVINRDAEVPESVDFAKFWVVWDDVNQSHIKRPLNAQKLLDGAIEGMVGGIGDPYTTYLNLENNKVAKDSLNGKYEGIGAQLGYDDNDRLIIVSPLEGSPAEAAGIRPGDIIVNINGETADGMTIETAVSKIRGDAGTSVTLNMYREGWDVPRDILIVRDAIKVESVTWEDKGDGIAYIRLSRFGESTNSDWDKIIQEIKYQMPNLEGVVLDVRSNPGGYLDSAVHIGSEFVGEGVIVTENFSDGTKQEFRVNRKGNLLDKDVDVAVLIDGGSASAAEIVAAALKERREAVIVGTRSFGKGSVQKSEEYQDKTALHVTIAKWLTPDMNWLDKANSEFKDSVYNEVDPQGNEIVGGLKPDHVVEIQEGDIEKENDSQMQKAIDLIKEANGIAVTTASE